MKSTFKVAALIIFLITLTRALYTDDDFVITLTEENFKENVLDSPDLWVVEFYAPWCGHCKKLTPEYIKAAKALKGIVKIGSVDGTNNRKLMDVYQIKGYPTIKIFAASKSTPLDYGGPRNAIGIVNVGLDEVKKLAMGRLEPIANVNEPTIETKAKENEAEEKPKEPTDVIELTDDNFEETVLKSDSLWMVEFFAPWCGHCKKLAPEWAKAAKLLKGIVNVGAMDATVHKVKPKDYGVRGYPTIKFFNKGVAEDYSSGRKAEDIVKFAESKLPLHIPEEL